MEDFFEIVGSTVAVKEFGTTYSNLKSEGKFNLIEDIELKRRLLNIRVVSAVSVAGMVICLVLTFIM